MRIYSCLLQLCVVLCFSFQALCQPGFLSLDCGGSGNYTDSLGIQWTPDDGFISTGKVAIASSSSSRELQTLRYFPGPSRKHCYSLPVTAQSTYLLRTYFNYANYDKLEDPPSMDLQIGVDIYTTAEPADYEFFVYNEFSFFTPDATVDFCLGSRKHVPFVSAILLRPLGAGMYQTSLPNQGLVLWARMNLGATGEIRYPDDEYDRLWEPDGLNTYSTISTNQVVDNKDLPDQPPSKVLQTAIVGDTSIIYDFPYVTISSARQFYINFYFADIDRSNTSIPRVFSVWLNSSLSPPSKFFSGNIVLRGGSIERFRKQYPLSFPTSFQFIKNDTADPGALGPVLNAAEILEVIDTSSERTNPNDVKALNGIKAHFNLQEWSGDPCLPVQYEWDWIKCDGNFRIKTLNLSRMNLIGSVPDAITELSHLSEIYLDNNNLRGLLPNMSSLTSLTILHLQNNELNGSIPETLLGILALKDLQLQNNSLTQCSSARRSLSLNISGNPCSTSSTASGGRKRRKNTQVISIAVAIPVVCLLGSLLFSVLLHRRRQKAKQEAKQPALFAVVNGGDSQKIVPSPRSANNGKFSYQTIVEATDGFRQKLGEGGFGPVYYGKLSGGREVAVKKHAGRSQGILEFQNEVDVLSVVHHRNLVSFVGYCDHDSKLILVYEYLSNGTLLSALSGGLHLSWRQRLNIALDAARGLEYLHTACSPRVIHRDVKSSNILLSHDLVAKVADFGLSKLYQKDEVTHVSTVVKGTFGYLDPAYHYTGRLNEKSDVYSFGVVLLEIISGRPALDTRLSEEQVGIVRWAFEQVQQGTIELLVDKRLDNYNEQSVWKAVEIALDCTQFESSLRPLMNTVVNELKEATRM